LDVRKTEGIKESGPFFRFSYNFYSCSHNTDGGYRLIALPAKARLDALHIAVAALHQMNFLLTWNCTHIANPIQRPMIESVIRSFGYTPPVICTPQELLEALNVDT